MGAGFTLFTLVERWTRAIDMKAPLWDNQIMKSALMQEWWEDIRENALAFQASGDWEKLRELEEEFDIWKQIMQDDLVDVSFEKSSAN